jgi:hypothetical protein
MVTEDIRTQVVSYIQHQSRKTHDDIAALVESHQQRLLDLVSGVSPEAAVRKPAPDEWSLRELLLHVVGSEEGVARLVTRLAKGDAPTRNGEIGRLADGPDDYGELLDRLSEANVRMLEAIRSLPDEPDLEATALHPFFGDLNCREWAVFQRIHDTDHLQHAEKIIAAVGR